MGLRTFLLFRKSLKIVVKKLTILALLFHLYQLCAIFISVLVLLCGFFFASGMEISANDSTDYWRVEKTSFFEKLAQRSWNDKLKI